MKTSKIIFISLLGTIAILILAALVDIRIRGHRNSNIQAEFNVNKQSVASFRVFCVNNSRNITLVKSDSSFIELTYLKDSIAPDINYTIKGDTLLILDFENLIHRNVSVRIHTTDLLNRIILKNSHISIDRLSLGKLFFELDESELWLNQYKTLESSFQVLNIVAKNHSRINSSEFSIDSLDLDLHNSEANFQLTAKVIRGMLSDSSKINVRQPQEISLKRDATSKVDVSHY